MTGKGISIHYKGRHFRGVISRETERAVEVDLYDPDVFCWVPKSYVIPCQIPFENQFEATLPHWFKLNLGRF